MLKIAFIIMVLLAVCNVALWMKKINIVRLSIFSIAYTTFMYILISGMLFWADVFSIQKAVLLTVVLQACIGLVLWKFRGKPEIKIEYRRYLMPLVIVFVGLPLVWNKYGFYGMGQDEGVYQNHAIQFMYGQNDVQRDFGEYHGLETESEKTYYKQELHEALTGYYFYDITLQTTDKSDKISDISGTIHGIPTFAAMLALWGRLFGIVNMVSIQTVFYVCAIFLMFFLTEELKLKKGVQVLLTGLLAISPIILWTAKSSLTEIFIVVIMECYLYGILNHKDKIAGWWGVLAITVFAFYHITNYTVLPIFVAIYWVLFLYYRKKRYLYQCITMVSGAFIGICMSCYVAPAYTIGGMIDGRRTGNFKPLYNMLPWINESNVLTVIAVASLMVIVISFVLMFWLSKIKVDCNRLKTVTIWGFRIILTGALIILALICIKKKTDDVSWLTQIQMSTFVSYGMATGGIVLVVLCLLWLLKTKVLVKNSQNFVMALLFIYCILFYAIKLKPLTGYFYYYGRYLAPYIPILLICAGILLNEFRDYYAGGILVASVCLLLPYLSFFYNESDDTQLDRGTLVEIESVIDNDSIVIMTSQTGRFLYLPVRTMTGSAVYFAEEDMEAQVDKLDSQGKSIYYITMSADTDFLENIYDVDVVLRVTDDTGENCEFYPNSYFSFPVRVTDEQTVVSCYKFR